MHGKFLLLALVVAGSLALRLDAQLPNFGDIAKQGLKAEAEAGDAEAQFQYGLQLIFNSPEDKKSAAQGAAWVQKAAKQDHLKAMHVLGALYADGVGIGQDDKLAVQWQQKAADKDMPEAQTALGLHYAQGKGVAKDLVKGLEWIKKAADQNYLEAQALYAGSLVRGDGVPKNASKAAVWFLRAAQQETVTNERQLGYRAHAQRQLAYLYYTGNGVPVDYERCEGWYRRSLIGTQDPMAYNDLAWFLSTCPDDKYHKGPEAVQLARKAIKLIEDNTGEQRHEVIDTMAAALARCGQFTEALVWQKRCLTLLKEDKAIEEEDRKKLDTEFSERVKLYTEKKPYADKAVKPEKTGEPLLNDRVLEDARQPAPRQQVPPQRAPEKKKDTVT